jgi:hypothetical protein
MYSVELDRINVDGKKWQQRCQGPADYSAVRAEHFEPEEYSGDQDAGPRDGVFRVRAGYWLGVCRRTSTRFSRRGLSCWAWTSASGAAGMWTPRPKRRTCLSR